MPRRANSKPRSSPATTPTSSSPARRLPASTLKELIEAAKDAKFSYGMPGPGTTPHLSAERIFKSLAKVDIPPVPFTGAAPSSMRFWVGTSPSPRSPCRRAIALIKSGEIKALAVLSDKRVPSLPQVPTAIEQGYGDSEESTWIGLFVPAATPAAVINKLKRRRANAVLTETAIGERLEQLGMVPVGGSPDSSEVYVRSEIKKWGEVVRSLGVKTE